MVFFYKKTESGTFRPKNCLLKNNSVPYLWIQLSVFYSTASWCLYPMIPCCVLLNSSPWKMARNSTVCVLGAGSVTRGGGRRMGGAPAEQAPEPPGGGGGRSSVLGGRAAVEVGGRGATVGVCCWVGGRGETVLCVLVGEAPQRLQDPSSEAVVMHYWRVALNTKFHKLQKQSFLPKE